MNRVYLRGDSLISSLGENKEDAFNKLQSIKESNYQDYLDEVYDDKNYFSIKNNYTSSHDKFYKTLEKTILDAISDAKLSKEEQKQTHIFLASTSMTTSYIEDYNKKYKTTSQIGYGDIINFVENLIETKYPTNIIQTACTSSVNAMIYASEQIQTNKIKRALVIGLEFFNKATYEGFNSLMLLSKSGIYKPFDKNSDGLILGEACCAIILDTKKSNENNFELISSSILFDDHSVTSSNPSGEVSLNSMGEALNKAKLSVKDLDFIKAHCAGTESSNISEVNAIDSLFKSQNEKTNVLCLKPYIGHTLGACGTSEIVLLNSCIQKSFVPKTLNYQFSYENIEFEPMKEDITTINSATILFQYIGFAGGTTSIILSNKS